MAKRPNIRAIKSARSYDVLEAARALNVTAGTVRGWITQGLPALKKQRPILILGHELRAFLSMRHGRAKVPLLPDQLYCLRCKLGQRPMGMLLDFTPQSVTTARLMGLCEVCGGTCNRMVRSADLPRLATIFEIACREGG